MKIVADNQIPYLADVLAREAQVVTMDGEGITPREVRDADILLVRTRTRCDRKLLEGSSVQLICTATIGYDHIDMEWCREQGIEVVTAAGCNARAVLQWVGAVLALHLSRRAAEPSDCTLGIVGVGNVGRLVAEYARSWGFKVLCSDPPREEAEGLGRAEGFVPLDELLATADIVTLHPLLSREGSHPTYHLIGERELALMRPRTALINASRGEVIDTAALLSAISSKRLDCYLDVWEDEPNKISEELVRKAVISTFHIAGYSIQGKANASSIVMRALSERFGLPFTDWYPSEVVPTTPQPISWDDMVAQIDIYCPLEEIDIKLKTQPSQFERFRKNYSLRKEFF